MLQGRLKLCVVGEKHVNRCVAVWKEARHTYIHTALIRGADRSIAGRAHSEFTWGDVSAIRCLAAWKEARHMYCDCVDRWRYGVLLSSVAGKAE